MDPQLKKLSADVQKIRRTQAADMVFELKKRPPILNAPYMFFGRPELIGQTKQNYHIRSKCTPYGRKIEVVPNFPRSAFLERSRRLLSWTMACR